MLPGFPTRLLKEVGSRFKERILKGASTTSIKVRVIDPPSRKYNVFIGASIVAEQTKKYSEAWKYKR
jgi:actin-related protein 2